MINGTNNRDVPLIKYSFILKNYLFNEMKLISFINN